MRAYVFVKVTVYSELLFSIVPVVTLPPSKEPSISSFSPTVSTESLKLKPVGSSPSVMV